MVTIKVKHLKRERSRDFNGCGMQTDDSPFIMKVGDIETNPEYFL